MQSPNNFCNAANSSGFQEEIECNQNVESKPMYSHNTSNSIIPSRPNHTMTTINHPVTRPRYPMTTLNHLVTTQSQPMTIISHPLMTQNYPGTTQNYPGTTQNYPGTTQNYPGTTQNYPVTTQNYPVTTQNHEQATRNHPTDITHPSTHAQQTHQLPVNQQQVYKRIKQEPYHESSFEQISLVREVKREEVYREIEPLQISYLERNNFYSTRRSQPYKSSAAPSQGFENNWQRVNSLFGNNTQINFPHSSMHAQNQQMNSIQLHDSPLIHNSKRHAGDCTISVVQPSTVNLIFPNNAYLCHDNQRRVIMSENQRRTQLSTQQINRDDCPNSHRRNASVVSRQPENESDVSTQPNFPNMNARCPEINFHAYGMAKIEQIARNNSLTTRDFIAITPCIVCGDRSSGVHYGTATCEGCKGFFRRGLALEGKRSFICTTLGHSDESTKIFCDINKVTRTKCQSCRWKKCKEEMKKEDIKFGRIDKVRGERIKVKALNELKKCVKNNEKEQFETLLRILQAKLFENHRSRMEQQNAMQNEALLSAQSLSQNIMPRQNPNVPHLQLNMISNMNTVNSVPQQPDMGHQFYNQSSIPGPSTLNLNQDARLLIDPDSKNEMMNIDELSQDQDSSEASMDKEEFGD